MKTNKEPVFYGIGSLIPENILPPRTECIKASLTAPFFNVIYWVDPNDKEMVDIFNKADLEYGVYVCHDIPFFLAHFPRKLVFDVSINIKNTDDEAVDEWLNRTSNLVSLLLVNMRSNQIMAMRNILIPIQISEKIRDILERQDHRYNSFEEVEKAAKSVMSNYTTMEMIKKTEMFK